MFYACHNISACFERKAYLIVCLINTKYELFGMIEIACNHACSDKNAVLYFQRY